MEYTQTPAEKSTVKIAVTFDGEEWAQANDKAYAANRGKYSIPGFRKGKVPKSMLLNYYGKGLFYDEALNILFNDSYYDILDKEKDNFRAVADPEVSVDELEDDKVSLTITVPVMPEVNVKTYKGLKYSKYEAVVTDEQVDAEVGKIAERLAKDVDVTDRAAADGDTANIDFVGRLDGKEFEGGSDKGFDLVLGSGSFVPGFEEQVEGMNVGETKDIDIVFPEDYQAEDLAGKATVFTVTLNSLRTKERPEMTDELVKKYARCDTVEEYRRRKRDDLESAAKNRAQENTRVAIMDVLRENTECVLPDALVRDRTDSYMKQFTESLKRNGMDLESYLYYTGSKEEDIRGEFARDAERDLLNEFIMRKIVETENITAEDSQIDEKLSVLADESETSLEDLRKSVGDDYMRRLRDTVLTDNLFAFLEDNNEPVPAEEPAE